MTNEEANKARDEARRSVESALEQSARTQAERDAARATSSEKAAEERRTPSKDREQEVNRRNSERRQQRESATNALTSGSADIKLAEIAKLGGPVGRKLERDIRQFQQTGRVSSWLAGETLKAEAAQNAAQQSAFRQQVVDVISSPASPILIGPIVPPNEPLNKKPEIRAEGGGGSECNGLGLYTKKEGTTTQVWVGAGSVASKQPSGFDTEKGKSVASSGSGDVWAEVTVDQETGEITSVDVGAQGNTPTNTTTKFYYTLGYYKYEGTKTTVTNYGCGSVEAIICRNWFAAESPYYGVTLNRCGCGNYG